MKPRAVGILSDHALLRGGLACMLRHRAKAAVSEHDSAVSLYEALKRLSALVVLMDLGHRADEVGEVFGALTSRFPECRVITLGTMMQRAALCPRSTAHLDVLVCSTDHLLAMVEHPEAPGIIPQTPHAELTRAWEGLTVRQREVLQLLATGADNLKIAAILGVSERAVKAHVTSLLTAFAAENRTELAVIACRSGVGLSDVRQPPELPRVR